MSSISYKTYSFRIFPNQSQLAELLNLSNISIEIYNYFLKLNKDLYKKEHKIYTNFQMHKLLTPLRKTNITWQLLNCKATQSLLTNLYNNYKSFFQLIKKDKSSRPPDYLIPNNYRTLTFNQSGWIIKDNIIEINKIQFNYKSYIDISKLNIKELKIIYKNNKWIVYAVIENKIEKPKELLIENKILALDLGLKLLATGIDTNSNLIQIHNKPKKIDKYISKQINRIKSKQSKCNKYSKRYNRLNKIKRRLYKKKNSQKKQYLHIQVNNLMNMNYNTIIVGDLQVKKLMELDKNKKCKISKSFGQSNISMFINILTYKGNEKNINVIKVNETNTTQLNCLTNKLFKNKIELSDRTVKLSDNIEIDRDLNSAINIYNRYYSHHLAALTPPLDLSSVLNKYNLFREPVVF